MAVTAPVTMTIFEDNGAICMARIYGAAGTAVTQAAITGISYKVFDLDSATPYTAVSTGSLTVANVIFDTLQTGGPWDKDTTGYNFKDTRPATNFTTGGHTYRIEYLVDPASGENFFLPPFHVYCEPVHTS
uniref:Uncharacterized protein n=1 Tax=viral metagenome TaxID=1070528 RepID=A0A6M3LB96_9ZZZZ